MKKIAIILLMVVLTIAGTPVLAAGETQISVTPITQNLNAGDTALVNITVAPTTPIAGLQFDLTFDPTLISVKSVTEGDFLKQGGATSYFMQGTVDNNAGTIKNVAGVVLGQGKASSTNGIFAIIEVQGKGKAGDCVLTLSDVIAGDINGIAIPIVLTNGTITITFAATDINMDGRTNLADLLIVLNRWRDTGANGWIREDVNKDGRINLLDAILIAQNWLF